MSNDQMAGGAGNDLYVVDSTLDAVTEAADEGIDTVDAKVSYTLADNVENLRLVGTTSISGTGNGFDNVLVGTDALYGMDGNDTPQFTAGISMDDIATRTQRKPFSCDDHHRFEISPFTRRKSLLHFRRMPSTLAARQVKVFQPPLAYANARRFPETLSVKFRDVRITSQG